MLRLSAAAAGATALAPVLESERTRQEAWTELDRHHRRRRCRTDRRLYFAETRREPIVFEASNRWGGRMFTRYNFYKGMFCELGGELVDTNHKDLQEPPRTNSA